MTTLAFDEELAYGNRHKISVPVRVENLPFLIDAVIDTGATVSVFDRALLPSLGIDIVSGREISLVVANNRRDIGYLHSLQIEIFGRQLIIPVAFSLAWPEGTSNLLGMTGFFEQILIAFEHQARKLHYSFY